MTVPASIDEMEFDFRRAEQYRRSGNFKDALDGYLTIISNRQERAARNLSPLTAADLVVIERAAELAILFGHNEGADNLLGAMSSALEGAENFFSADYITIKRIHLALSFGKLQHARTLLRAMSGRIGDVESLFLTDAGLDAWEFSCRWDGTTPQDRAVVFSQLYLVLGWLLSSLGQYVDGLLMLQRGLRFTGNEAPDLARRAAIPLRLTVVSALLEQGDLGAAREKLNELEPVLDKKSQPGSFVRWAELGGKLGMLEGDFGSALVKLSAVRDLCEENAFRSAKLVAMLNLSHVLIFLNYISVAQQILRSVIAQASELNEPYVIASAERQLAVARERSSSFEGTTAVTPLIRNVRNLAAEETSSRAFPEIPPSESFLSLFEDRTLEFYWQLNRGNLEMAYTIVCDLLEAFGKSDSTIILLRLQVIEGTLAYFTGQFEHAERVLGHTLPALQEAGLKPDLWQAQRILGWCWVRLGFSKTEYERLSASNQQLLSAMTASLPPAYQAVFMLNKWTAEEEFIAGEIDQLEALKNKLESSRWFRKPMLRWSLMKRIHRLQQYIERYRHSLASDAKQDEKPKGPSLWQVIWNHPKDRATISFLVLPDRVLIVHAGWMKLDFEIARVSRIEIRETIRHWHVLVNNSSAHRGEQSTGITQEDLIKVDYLDKLVTATRNLEPLQTDTTAASADEASNIAEKLAQQLLLPSILSGLPRGVRALTIVPHDSLLGFPFAAITHEGNYLFEKFKLNTDVGFLNQEQAGKSSDGMKALFVGVSSGGGNFQRLPGVLREISKLEQWCEKSELPYHTLIDDAATKPSIVEHLNGSTLLHMACHGIFRADQPDASGLVLITSAGKVEVLSLRELSELNLTNLRHVSLSSCSSADNFILPGRLIIGLPETFRRGGVESILACLWAIDDRFATAFAARFYEYLNNYPRDETLRRTQLDCLKKKHSDGQLRPLDDIEGINTTDPFYWASYILCGHPGRLHLRSAAFIRGSS